MTEEQKKAFMDKYTFSPEYIIDILSDSNGVIDLTVPLKGTTTAPDFDVSGIAVKAAGGMAAKVVTAPLDSAGSAAKGVVDVAGGTAKTAADAAGKAVQGSLRAVGSLLKTISPFGK